MGVSDGLAGQSVECLRKQGLAGVFIGQPAIMLPSNSSLPSLPDAFGRRLSTAWTMFARRFRVLDRHRCGQVAASLTGQIVHGVENVRLSIPGPGQASLWSSSGLATGKIVHGVENVRPSIPRPGQTSLWLLGGLAHGKIFHGVENVGQQMPTRAFAPA
jgi:hypothetical protein